MAGWSVTAIAGMVNVVRIGDDPPHIPGADCWCGPRLSLGAGGSLLVLHTASDGSWLV